MVLGIIGKICAGKDFVSKIFQENGYTEIDLDQLGHIALLNNTSTILDSFYQSVAPNDMERLIGENTIDRKELGMLVFRNPSLLSQLERILHPAICNQVFRFLSEKADDRTRSENLFLKERTYILNGAILEKLDLLKVCDLVLWVEAPLWLRALRFLKREKLLFSRFYWINNKVQKKLTLPEGKTPPVYRIQNPPLWKYGCNARSTIMKQLNKIAQLTERKLI